MSVAETSSTNSTATLLHAKKRVLIADAHSSICDLIEMALTLEGGCQVLGHVGLGADVLEQCRSREPEILILDPKLPDISGADIIRRVRKEHRHVRILAFSGASNREIILEVLDARPHGFAHKEEPLRVFYDVLHAIVGGSQFYSPYGVRLMEPASEDEQRSKGPLAPREKEVLKLLALGHSSKEIAFGLNLAVKTVDHYRTTLMTKLGIHEVAGLTRYAVSAGMVSVDG